MRERASDAAAEGEQRALPSSFHERASERASSHAKRGREKRRSTSNFSAAKGVRIGRDKLPKVIEKLGKIDPTAERIAFAPSRDGKDVRKDKS